MTSSTCHRRTRRRLRRCLKPKRRRTGWARSARPPTPRSSSRRSTPFASPRARTAAARATSPPRRSRRRRTRRRRRGVAPPPPRWLNEESRGSERNRGPGARLSRMSERRHGKPVGRGSGSRVTWRLPATRHSRRSGASAPPAASEPRWRRKRRSSPGTRLEPRERTPPTPSGHATRRPVRPPARSAKPATRRLSSAFVNRTGSDSSAATGNPAGYRASSRSSRRCTAVNPPVSRWTPRLVPARNSRAAAPPPRLRLSHTSRLSRRSRT